MDSLKNVLKTKRLPADFVESNLHAGDDRAYVPGTQLLKPAACFGCNHGEKRNFYPSSLFGNTQNHRKLNVNSRSQRVGNGGNHHHGKNRVSGNYAHYTH